jgi:hypothetical protein
MISLMLKNVAEIAPGVWLTRLNPSDVRRFGQNATSVGQRSIVSVATPSYDKVSSSLSVPLDSIVALNVGRQEETIVLDLDYLEDDNHAQDGDHVAEEPEIDREFVDSCRVHLPEETTSLIIRVLSEVRGHHQDKLIEGQGRKWTASPNNFFAVTIQNRNRQFLVSVKANPSKHAFRHIHLKRSRAPYCEFYLNSYSQIDEAVKIILASAKY